MSRLEGYRFRHPVTVANDGTASVDVEIVIPEHWDHFWENTLASGFDAVLTHADGVTILDFDRVGWNQATRTGTLRIGALDVEPDANTNELVWLYYQNPSATDQAGTPTIGTTVPGVPYLGTPTEPRVNVTRRSRSALANVVQKTSEELIYVWFRVQQLLEDRLYTDGGSLRWEEVKNCQVQVLEDNELRPGMVGLVTKYTVDARGDVWIGAGVQAGLSGLDFTIALKIGTSTPPERDHRILNPRALLRVRDLTES